MEWESILVASAITSPAFREDLALATHLAPREMERTRERARLPTRGRIRGKVDARRTLRLRRRRQDPTLWVVSTPLRRWQTDDNAAVVGLLEHLRRVSSRLTGGKKDGWRAEVAKGSTLLERLLRVEPVRHVTPDSQWSAHELSPVLLARSRFYRVLWRYARALRESRATADPSALQQVIRRGWLAAEDDDRLYELYVLGRVVEILHSLGPWDEFQVTAPIFGAPTVLKAAGESREVTVRFDRAPSPGLYQWLFRRYEDLSGAARRPDLQITVRTPTGSHTTLVEVKATDPTTAYGRDSIYKALGYLKDYSELWQGSPGTKYPHIVLAFATGVRGRAPLRERVAADEVLLTSHAGIDQDMRALIVRMLTEL